MKWNEAQRNEAQRFKKKKQKHTTLVKKNRISKKSIKMLREFFKHKVRNARGWESARKIKENIKESMWTQSGIKK